MKPPTLTRIKKLVASKQGVFHGAFPFPPKSPEDTDAYHSVKAPSGMMLNIARGKGVDFLYSLPENKDWPFPPGYLTFGDGTGSFVHGTRGTPVGITTYDTKSALARFPAGKRKTKKAKEAA